MAESPDMNMSRFDGMSTEKLKDILYQDFFLQDKEGYSADEILYISGLVAEREKTTPGQEYPDAGDEWKVFVEKYLPTAGEASLYGDDATVMADQESADIGKRRRTPRVLLIAAVLAALLTVFTVTAYALGYAPFKAVATWTKDLFGFTTEDPEAAGMQAEMDKIGITEFSAPKYLPEGFEQTGLDSIDMGYYSYLIAFYKDSSHVIAITAVQHFDDTHLIHYQKDEAPPEVIERDETEYYCFTNDGHNVAVWIKNGVEYGVSSDLSREEVLKIAFSMS